MEERKEMRDRIKRPIYLILKRTPTTGKPMFAVGLEIRHKTIPAERYYLTQWTDDYEEARQAYGHFTDLFDIMWE